MSVKGGTWFAAILATCMFATIGGGIASGAPHGASEAGSEPVALASAPAQPMGVVTGKCDAPTGQGNVKGYIDRNGSTGEVWGYVIGRGCSLTGSLRVDMYRNTDSGLKHLGGRAIGCRVDYCYSTTPTFKMVSNYESYCVKITYNYLNNMPAGVSKWTCGG